MTYEQLLKETALADERFVVMTAENRALVRNLPAVLGKRFIDTGITEQCMVGMSAGLALRGRIPVIHALSAFLSMRAYEFVRTDIGIGNLPVKLSSFIPGFLSDANGPTHQAIEDIALMRGIPNMTVFAPADEDDLVKSLPAIWASASPAYVRINTRPSKINHAPFEIGKAEVLSKGTDITFLTYGLMLEQVVEAADILRNAGKSVGVINMRTLKPVDVDAILNVSRFSERIITVEDHFKTGGLYSIVAEILLDHGLKADVTPFALNDKWFKPALLPAVLEYEGFTSLQIAEKILGKKVGVAKTKVHENTFDE